MPKPEEMNTINADGKAWDGRIKPLIVAACAMVIAAICIIAANAGGV